MSTSTLGTISDGPLWQLIAAVLIGVAILMWGVSKFVEWRVKRDRSR